MNKVLIPVGFDKTLDTAQRGLRSVRAIYPQQERHDGGLAVRRSLPQAIVTASATRFESDGNLLHSRLANH